MITSSHRLAIALFYVAVVLEKADGRRQSRIVRQRFCGAWRSVRRIRLMPHLFESIRQSGGASHAPCERQKWTGEDDSGRRELADGSARSPRAGARGARVIEGTADRPRDLPGSDTGGAKTVRSWQRRTSERRTLLICLRCLSVTLRPPKPESSRHRLEQPSCLVPAMPG